MANKNGKTVDVVFERKNFKDSTTAFLSKYGTLEPIYKEFVRNMTKEKVRNTIKNMHFKHELAENKTNIDFECLIEAIKRNNERDTVQKENFVTKVEAVMQKLSEVENLRKHYDNVMKKIPEITEDQNKEKKSTTVVNKSSITFLKSGKNSTKSGQTVQDK